MESVVKLNYLKFQLSEWVEHYVLWIPHSLLYVYGIFGIFYEMEYFIIIMVKFVLKIERLRYIKITLKYALMLKVIILLTCNVCVFKTINY